MSNFKILTESSCDLPASLADELGLAVIPLTVNVGDFTGPHYLDERKLATTDFYKRLQAGEPTSTAAANIEEFKSYMQPILQAGEDILYMGFSSALSSGTANAAAMAAAELREMYPERQILLTDTLCASGGEGLLVYLASQRRQNGDSLAQVRDYVEQTKLHLCHWFTVDDLNHLRRGGRLSGVSAIVGTMLNIKPVLHVDNEGRLIPMEKVRGRKAAIRRMADHFMQTAAHPEEQTILINHACCLEDAQYLAQLLKEHVKEIRFSYIGPVIGAHCGTGTLALFFLGTQR